MVGNILDGCLFESVLTIWCSSLLEDAVICCTFPIKCISMEILSVLFYLFNKRFSDFHYFVGMILIMFPCFCAEYFVGG